MSDAKIPEDLQAGYSKLRGWKESQDVQKTASLATLMLIESGLLYIERIAQAEAALADLRKHLSHCNFGENMGCCKYDDDNCPALDESWSWFGLAIQKKAALESALAAVTEDRDRWQRMHENAVKEARLAEAALAERYRA